MIKKIWMITKVLIKVMFKKIGIDVKKSRPLRPSMGFIYKYFADKQIIGAEVGVKRGINAFSMLKYMDIKKLYLVDPYEAYVEYTEDVTDSILGEAERQAKERLSRFSEKTIWIKKYSNDALDDVPNELDFVYVDGNHAYKYVKEDINNYYKKLKVSGVLAGHDVEGEDIIKAVREFVNENNLQLNISVPDWWIIKR